MKDIVFNKKNIYIIKYWQIKDGWQEMVSEKRNEKLEARERKEMSDNEREERGEEGNRRKEKKIEDRSEEGEGRRK